MATGRAPIRKVSAGAAGGAVATVALWLIDLTGVELPPAVAAAITLLIMAGVAYLVPSAPGEARPPK